MSGGTYTLLVERTSDGELGVGALGDLSLPAGWYAYTGSAFGPGGFARIDRHRRVATGANDARHWHVDYLLGDADASLVDVVKSPGVDAECAIAEQITGERVPEFGCSDCDCGSHLVYRADRDALRESVERVHRRARE